MFPRGIFFVFSLLSTAALAAGQLGWGRGKALCQEGVTEVTPPGTREARAGSGHVCSRMCSGAGQAGHAQGRQDVLAV